MRAIIKASKLCRAIPAPPSKSMAHRLIICAALSEGESRISNVAFSEDIEATVRCLRALGADIQEFENSLIIRGRCADEFKSAELDCGESGSTLRFLIPLAAMSGEEMRFSGRGRLMSRPLEIYEEIFGSEGLIFEKREDGLRVKGRLRGGEYRVRADISSQFISGLMLALSQADEDSIIRLEGSVESRPYIEMSMQAMKTFGVDAVWINGAEKDDATAGEGAMDGIGTEDSVADIDAIFIKGGQVYRATDAAVEGDWSNAAYLMTCGAEVSGLDYESPQGDKVCCEYFKALDEGAAELDISDCPDLGPVLMAYAAMRHGCTLLGTKRLSIKESDRGAVMKAQLAKFGADCEMGENYIKVGCRIRPPSESLCGHNDHRIVMALAAMCMETGGVIEGAEAVAKSYPDFFDRIKEAGASVITEEPEK